MMQSPEYSPVVHHSDASRPSLGFPLGTAMLLIVIFSLSGIFSCCYHWDKFRSLRQSFSDDLEAGRSANDPSNPTKPNANYLAQIQEKMQSVPVIMPGDDIPTFIALPCPCEPLRPEKLTPVTPALHKPLKPQLFPPPCNPSSLVGSTSFCVFN